MPEPDDFDPTDLEQLLTLLRQVIPADTDPTKVSRLPGVWVRFDGFTADHLHGLTVNTTLHVVVSDNERPLATLATTFNLVKNHLRANGLDIGDPVQPVGLVLPVSQTPLPCLSVPLALLTCQTP